MLRKELVIPPEAAQAFVRDMRAFFKASGQLMQDEIAAKQVWLLKQHLPRRDEAANFGCERAVPADEGSGVKIDLPTSHFSEDLPRVVGHHWPHTF